MMMAYPRDEQEALLTLGHTLLEAGQWEDARAIWEGLAEAGSPETLGGLAFLALCDDRWHDVTTWATAALERSAGDSFARLLRAEACIRTGRYAEGSVDLGHLVNRESREPMEQAITARASVLLARLRRPGRMG